MLFISGRVSLDLAHTGGRGEAKAFERLHEPTDFTQWLEQSPLHLHNVTVTKAVLEKVYDLREAIWLTANAIRTDAPADLGHVTLINKTATKTPLAPVLDTTKLSFAWVQPATASAALSVIARDAIDLFSRRSELPVQQCANPTCPLLFVDGSRPGKRKWCSMGRCGNLIKVTRHRRNRKG